MEYTTIPADSFSPVIPFCWDVTGKRMKLGCIENISNSACVLFIEGTEMRYNLHKNERLLCVLSEENTFVQAVARVQYRDSNFIFLDGNNMHLIYDGIFRFYRNGSLEFTLKDDEKFFFRLSDNGNPFVFADHGVVIDADGYLKAPDDCYHRYHKWSSHHYAESCPGPRQYISAMYKGRAGITTDRKVIYEEDFIRGIPEPVVAISLSWAGLWALTANGHIYLADVDQNHDAVLIAQNATAISSSNYEQYFVFSDTAGDLHVYNCSEFQLNTKCDQPYLRPFYTGETTYTPKILHPGRGRISELCIHEGALAFRCLHGGRGIIHLPDGRPMQSNRF